jgi:hypothetical protein
MVSSLLRHALGQALRTPHALRFAAASRRPARAQAALLREILARGASSELGRRLGLGSIAGPAEYARRVPIMTAGDLSAYASRLMKGERGLLTPDPPIFYAATTGTSGAHKVVPVTARYRADFQKTVHVALSHMFARFPAAFTSRVLYFVAARRVFQADDGLDVGYMSGFNYTVMPRVARALYAWPYEMFSVADLAARAYLAVLFAVRGDVSIIAGVFPLGIVQLLRDLETHAEALARDLRRGTLDGAPGLTPAERARFTAMIDPRPDLAERLARAARAPVEEKVAEALPRLRLCYCWTTSTAGLYVPELARRLGPRVAVRDAIYAASEAWCNVTLGDEEPGGPAAVSSVFLELVPEEELEEAAPRTVGVEAAEDGRRYGVVVTTSAGLYRYAVGDVVEVAGRHHATPRIRFVRKTGASSNLAGELLDETHVTAAVPAALAAAGASATWFALVADPAGPLPGYDLRLELAPGSPAPDLAALGADVDRRLVAGALTYGDKLGTRLRPIRVVLVPAGRWEAWRRARLASGAGDAQLKTVHLVPAGAPAGVLPA